MAEKTEFPESNGMDTLASHFNENGRAYRVSFVIATRILENPDGFAAEQSRFLQTIRRFWQHSVFNPLGAATFRQTDRSEVT
ncbi:MAG: hypothetical protein VX111_11180 [Planctomycetota bacterium]|nr:hypothetical protein [Planctomycetota bacterium]